MGLNVELAEQVVIAIKENPERHDQDHWRVPVECDTAMCAAGWAGQLAGGVWVTSTYGSSFFDSFLAESQDPDKDVMTAGDINFVRAGVRGKRVLGLTQDQADYLFTHVETEDVVDVLEGWIAEAKAGSPLSLAVDWEPYKD